LFPASGGEVLRAKSRASVGSSGAVATTANLEALIQELLEHNPGIQAARKRYEAALTRPSREGALPDPKFAAGWTSAGFPLPGFGLGSNPGANIGFTVSQEFPFPGKRTLRRSIAAEDAEKLDFEVRRLELSTISSFKSAFYDLAFVDEATEVLRRNRDLLQRLSKVAEARYVVGKAQQQDLIKAEVEINLIDAREVQLQARKGSLEVQLNTLLGRQAEAPFPQVLPFVDVPPLPSLEEAVARCLKRSPMLLAQRTGIDARVLGIEAARKDYYPDFELMGGYFNQASMKDMWDFRLQINIPLYFGSKQRRGVEEANLLLSEAYREYRADEQQLQFRIRDRHRMAEAAGRLMSIYRERVIPQSTLALESALNSYETGALDFLSILSNFQSILENEYRYLEQKAEYLKALAEMEELAGGSVNEP